MQPLIWKPTGINGDSLLPLQQPVPLPESLYLWLLGVAIIASWTAIPVIRQCDEDIESITKAKINACCKKAHNPDFYLEMFHLSRGYHNLNSQIKYTCWSLAGIFISCMIGVAYQQMWYIYDDIYIHAANGVLLISGIFFIINAMQLSWRYIKRR